MNTLILVDTSYTLYYRFFATLKWYSFAFPEDYKLIKNDNTYDWTKNEVFIEKYEKMFLTAIFNIIPSKQNIIIFCMDSPKAQLWRTEIKPDYKDKRPDLSLKYNLDPIYEYTFNKIIPNCMKTHKNIYSIVMDKIEADDIIAIICMDLEKTDPDTLIYLISDDKDFLQLGRQNIIFINYKTKTPLMLDKSAALKFLNTKIIMGDKSDYIPSIFPKGSKIKKKKELIESEDKLQNYLELYPDIKKQYTINREIIDFNYIPTKYYNKIVKIYKKILI
jgi:5'-3' exonuclease